MPLDHGTLIAKPTHRRLRRAVVETLEKRTLYAGDGLQAAYFASADLSGPAVNRLDPQLNFSWKHAAPAKGVSPSPMSVRWTGDIVPPVSGKYTFITAAQGSVLLTLNGQPIISDWRVHRLRSDRAVLTLNAGQKYSLEIDYAAGKYPAKIGFFWTHRRQSRQVVPTGQLYSGIANPASNLAVNEVSGNQIGLTWQDNSDNEAGFRIERSADGGPFVPVTTARARSTSFTDTTAPHGVSLTYQVVATNVSGDSAPAAAPPLKPPAPVQAINLDASGVSGSEIDVTWQDPAGHAAAFVVERSTDGGQTFKPAATVAWPATTFRDTGLARNTNYSYRVIALNDTGSAVATYPIIANTLSGVTNTHPEPTRLGPATEGWQFNTPADGVTVDSERPGNIFYVGDSITFSLDLKVANPAPYSYEVRDYYGNMVDSGPVTDPVGLTVAPQKPGWYKLYVYGPPSSATATFGDTVGGTTFTVFRPNSNFPSPDTIRARGNDYVANFTRIDPQINFDGINGWVGGTPDAAKIPAGPFAARWTGQLRPTQSGTYTFEIDGCVYSADGARIWIDGQELINGWYPNSATKGTIGFHAGQSYDIRVDFAYSVASIAPAFALSWSSTDLGISHQPIPQSVLHSSSTATGSTGDGLTATYYSVAVTGGNLTDNTVRAVTGMGPQRYQANAADPAATIASLDSQISFDSKYYVPDDPQRHRALLISFGTGTVGHLAGVTQIVQHFQNEVEYWEPQNEPNFTYGNGADFVPVMRDFYNTVKAVNPNLKVIGPGVVTVGPYGLAWLRAFFAAGGGQYIDAFSFHAYNNVNRDLTLARESLGGLKALLNQYGLGNIPIWQTEQGYMAAVYGDDEPQNQGEWTMLEQMVFEQYGIPKEQNVLWYDIAAGFWDFPVFWENEEGGLEPAAALMRVWSEELYGTNFSQAYDFGADGNNTYIGSLFTGPGKSVAAFMTGGATDGQVTLNVAGGASVHVVDPFGNASDVPLVNGQATFTVGNLPVYVELAAGQTISVVPVNWGPDLATQPGVTASSSSNGIHPIDPTVPNSLDKIHDGVLQNWYYNFQPSTHPWMDNTPPGTSDWVELDLPTAQSIDHVVVRAPTPWQWDGAPLDYELQFQDSNGRWVTIQHVQEDPKTFGVLSPEDATTVDSFYSERSIFIHTFTPVTTSKIRLLVNNETWGGAATQEAYQAGGQTYPAGQSSPHLTLQEIEIYGQ